MSYCTLQNLIDRFGEASLVQLTDRAEVATGAIDLGVVARAIADTDAAIDGYVKVRYALPLPSVPAALTDVALAICFYKLHAHVTEEKVRQDYDDAIATLRDIAAGKFKLDVAGVEPEGASAGGVRTNEPARPLSADSMKGFI